jgi:hypothetical protein
MHLSLDTTQGEGNTWGGEEGETKLLIYFNREVLVGREGVEGFVEEAIREIVEADFVRVVWDDDGFDAVLATGIPEELAALVALASFMNLFGFPSSHWLTWLANRREQRDS